MSDEHPALPTPRPPTDLVSGSGLRPETGRLTKPRTPAGPVGELADHLLVQASGDRAKELFGLLPVRGSGLVITGKRSASTILQLRRAGYTGPLVSDSEGYLDGFATEDAPFILPSSDNVLDASFRVSLDDVLTAQRRNGATVALTPTGYIDVGESEALKAACTEFARLGRDDAVLSLPIDVGWLHEEHFPQLFAVLSRFEQPAALFLGAQFDPLSRNKRSTGNLRKLIAEAGPLALFRTDLAAFDAMTHGAFAASIGTGGSLRHVVRKGAGPRSRVKDPSPSVLHPELMGFFKGALLATKFANLVPAQTCDCGTCDGRELTRFLGRAESAEAHAHGIRVWSEWVEEMLSLPTLADRARWWKEKCARAVGHHDVVNTMIEQEGAFTPPGPLDSWATMPAWSATPAPKRSKTR
ncbi:MULTISPECIES: hypothetical protein [Actinosynnema]|uniref:hypothetical protein n=1 Tax=Actinosynnema TaxID=40566 RepID=UPI0020A24DBC|nr:hypothetical protein [Actinosynnema pretiosum]MCP2099814.1 hypothetical protein [Actinosynnema pretiosum]